MMASANPENIPSWDLSDFYSGPDAPEIDVAMDHPTIQARNLLAKLIEEEQ